MEDDIQNKMEDDLKKKMEDDLKKNRRQPQGQVKRINLNWL